MKQKLAFLASLGYSEMSVAEVCASLKSIGYGGVEWTTAHFNPRTMSARELADVAAVTKEHGLETSEVVVQRDLVCLDEDARRDRVGFVLECVEAASDAGVATLNVFTGPAPWEDNAPRVGADISEGAAWEMVLDAFVRIVGAAEKCGVDLAVEGVFGMLCHDYYTTRLLIDHFGSPRLGVNFDPSHDILYGNVDSAWIARQWGDRIKHMHLKDAAGVPAMGKFLFPLLGEGLVPWKDLFAAVDDIGYTGFMSVEFESFTYYRTVLESDVEAAARVSMEQLRKLIPGR